MSEPEPVAPRGPTRPTDAVLPAGPGEDIDLTRADVRFIGTTQGLAGIDVDFVGDLDGDGLDDLVIADRDYRLPSGERVGGVYLVYGRRGLEGDFPLERADATFAADTYVPGDLEVSPAGDVDGDGQDDFLFGGTFLIWGSTTRYSGVLAASSVGTELAGGRGAYDTVTAGDLDGDGRSDVIVGAWRPDGDDSGTAAVYVFYGRADRFGGATHLDRADAVLTSGDGSERLFGFAISARGDVDGDGYDDLLVGAPGDGAGPSGDAYLLYGGPQRWSGPVAMTGTHIVTSSEGEHGAFGLRVAIVGDVDGDGCDELVLADPYARPTSRVSLMYGRRGRFGPTLDLASADFVYEGDGHDTNLGAGLAEGGDINGDGFADLFFGSPNSPDMTQRGHNYVLLGGPSAFRGTIDTSRYDVRLTGTIDDVNGTDVAGYALANGGDFDGDGYDDLLVGAYGNRINDEYGGRTYLVYGR
ncbi:MAG: FG-GAP repeat protein [Sandaracinaceae bacterium]|nr:FG-GAP repeat protein [Sandaracinaceae bacterium]